MSSERGIHRLALAAVAGFTLASAAAAADGDPVVALTLRNHRFEPSDISVPAGVKVTINLTNRDGATEEFDSDDLGVEQVLTPYGRARFTIGPLAPGAYDFQGELHPTTAQGRIVAGQAR